MLNRGGAFSSMPSARLADIADTSDEKRRLRGTANVDAMQAASRGTDFDATQATRTPFARAVARAKALSRIVMQGDLQAEGQALRDRIGMSSLGQRLQAGTTSGYSASADTASEEIASQMRVAQADRAIRLNTLGTIAGGAMSGWMNRTPTAAAVPATDQLSQQRIAVATAPQNEILMNGQKYWYSMPSWAQAV